MHPIRYISLLLCLICLPGCHNGRSNPEKETTIHLYLLKGPSALAFAQWLDNPPLIQGKRVSFSFADSPEMIQAALIKQEADLAVLPLISAANLYNKGVHYSLLGCPVWGTLYLVGREPLSRAKEIHLFGAATTPAILARHYLREHNIEAPLNYAFGTPPELLQALLMGRAQMAVLSEPFVSMALQRDSTLHLVADLNGSSGYSSGGFPQTAIVCTNALASERLTLDSLLYRSCRFALEQPAEAIRILEKHRLFAPGTLTPEGVSRCKVNYRPAGEVAQEVINFLQLIHQYEPKALGGSLPDSDFILKTAIP